MSKPLASLAALLAAILISAAGNVAAAAPATQPAKADAEANSAPTPPVTQPAVLYKIAAKVNNAEIMESRIDAIMEGARIPENVRPAQRKLLLDKLITEELLTQMLMEQTKAPAQADIDKNISAARPQIEGNGAGTLEDQLAKQGMTMADFQKRVATSLRFKQWADGLVGEKDVSDYYEGHKEEFNYEVQASHILLQFPPDADEKKKAELKAKAEEIHKEVVSGKDFAELAAKYSDCPSKEKGGDLGYFPREGKMVEPFAAAAFSLETGHISPVVETQFGYHIIKVTDRKKVGDKKLPDVAMPIRNKLINQRIEQALDKKRKESKIEVY